MSWQPEPVAPSAAPDAQARTDDWSSPSVRPGQPYAPQQPYAAQPRAPQPYTPQPRAPQPYTPQPYAPSPTFGQPAPQLDPRFQPYGQPAPQLDPRFQPFGQATSQPDPRFQPFGQPAAPPPFGQQAYGQPYGQQPYGASPYAGGGMGFTGARPIAHHAASRSLMGIAVFVMVLSALRFLGANNAAPGNPYYSPTLAGAQVVSFLGALAVLALTFLGRRRADEGNGSLLRIAGGSAVLLGALSLVSLLTIMTTGRGIGVAGGISLLAAGIQTLRTSSA